MTALADAPTAPVVVAAGETKRGVLSSGWTKGLGVVVAVGVLGLVVLASLAFGSKSIPSR